MNREPIFFVGDYVAVVRMLGVEIIILGHRLIKRETKTQVVDNYGARWCRATGRSLSRRPWDRTCIELAYRPEANT